MLGKVENLKSRFLCVEMRNDDDLPERAIHSRTLGCRSRRFASIMKLNGVELRCFSGE